SVPVSPIIPLTFFNINSTPSNISLLTSTADYWSSVAVNCNIKQSSSSSYTPLYPQTRYYPIPISTQYIALLSPLVLPTTHYTIDYNIETSYQLNIKQSLLYLQFDEAT
ncbi:1217_t:CDS:2, partial [Gigaspora margarita]